MQTLNLDDLIALAIAAGDEIMAVRAAGFEELRKGDGSLVTEADHRAEAIIERGLALLAPDVPMIGEEAVAAGRIPDCGDTFFCVDPLDGTRGFAEGGEEFTVNIALVQEGAPSHGVVFAPVSGALYAGEPGRAVRADVGYGRLAMTAIRTQPRPGGTWRIVASRTFGRTENARRFAAALGSFVQDDASSSIKFCRVAEGSADLYPRFGDLNEWDAAAGHAVLRAAGGEIMSLEGGKIAYGRRDRCFLLHGLIAYANDDAAAAARAALARM